MLTVTDKIILGVLMFSCLIITILLNYLLNRKTKKQLEKIFIIIFDLVIFWLLSEMLQMIFVNLYNVEAI